MKISDLNLFMMCPQVNPGAFREMPEGFHIRLCREELLDAVGTAEQGEF